MAKNELITAGGQAVIEGVMMRSKKRLAVAVRKPNGKIVVKKQIFSSLSEKHKFFGLPIIRGIVNLIEMMVIGLKMLNYSANQAVEDEGEISAFQLAVSMVLAFGFAVFIFKFLPLFLAHLMETLFSFVKNHYFIFNLIDGAAKILIFLIYLYLISFMKDIKTLFMYHGAEHKAVNCFEKKLKLTVENVQKFSTSHPRCGTSFILIVLIISILVYSVIPKGYSFGLKFILRILLLPLIAGISYELLRFSGKYRDNGLVKLFVMPGMLVQKFSTKEPTDKQVEVAIKALKAVV